MTQDEIYEMVRQSDLGFLLGDNWMMHHELLAFANLVAAKEREACAKVAFSWNQDITDKVAEEIRARGEQA